MIYSIIAPLQASKVAVSGRKHEVSKEVHSELKKNSYAGSSKEKKKRQRPSNISRRITGAVYKKTVSFY